jgi:hypothetical protein
MFSSAVVVCLISLSSVTSAQTTSTTILVTVTDSTVQGFGQWQGSHEYGFNAGAQTIIVTKSGGNDWHGSVAVRVEADVLKRRANCQFAQDS